MRTHRRWLGIFLLLSLLAAAGCASRATLPHGGIAATVDGLRQHPPKDDSFRFIVLGDSQFMNDAIFDRVVAQAAARRPALVLQVGDQVPTERTQTAEDVRAQWLHHLGQTRRLNAPYLPIAGNHDLAYSPHDPAVWADVWGPTWYSFDYGNCHFIVLNTEDTGKAAGTLGDAQTEWLKADLAAAKAAHIFVFFHKPFWQDGAGWGAYHELFRKYPVKAVFAGHIHIYTYEMRDGIAYVTTIAVQTNEAPEAGRLSHHVEVDVAGDKLAMRVIHNGRELPMDFIDPVAAAAYDEKWFNLDPVPVAAGPVQVAFDVTNPLAVPVTFRAGFSEKLRGQIDVQPASAEVSLPAGGRQHVAFGLRGVDKLGQSSFSMDYSVRGVSGRGPFEVKAQRVVFLQPDLAPLDVAGKLPGRVVLVGPDKNDAMAWLLTGRIGLVEGKKYLRAATVEQLETLWPTLAAGDTLVFGHLPFFSDAKLRQWYEGHKADVRRFIEGGGRMVACIGVEPASRGMLADFGLQYHAQDEAWRRLPGADNGVMNVSPPLAEGLIGGRIVYHVVAVASGWFEPAGLADFAVLGTNSLGGAVLVARPLGKGQVILSCARLNSHHHMRFDGNQQRIWPNLLLLDAAKVPRS